MVNSIQGKFHTPIKRTPPVKKAPPVTKTGVDVGEGSESREQTDFSERKKSEAVSYGAEGQLYNEDGQEISQDDNYPKLDEPS